MAILNPNDAELPQIVNLSQVSAEMVNAGLARANQTTIRQLKANEVDLQTSVAGTIQAGELHARDSILGVISSNQSTVVDSIAGVIKAETLDFNGVAGMIVANSMANKGVNAIAVIGTDIRAETINTRILLSRNVHGNITTTMDGRSTLMAGVVGGVVTGLILLVGKMLLGNKK
jgi:hypothetical protein